MAKKPIKTFDVECYQNYFLIIVQDIKTGFVQRWEMFNGVELGRYSRKEMVEVFRSSVMVSFNGLSYDHPMICGYFSELTNSQLYELSQWVIKTEMSQWRWENEFDGIMNIEYTHIDIFAVAPGIASLKMYGGRLHHNKLQDLPVAWDKPVSSQERDILVQYCINDNGVTKLLFRNLKEQLILRHNLTTMYGMNLMSKSDAQIAEGVIKKELRKIGVEAKSKSLVTKDTYTYDAPDCIWFESEELRTMFDIVKSAKFFLSDKGSVKLPKKVREVVNFRGMKYQFGIGGLHSKESAVSFPPISGTTYVDWDVTSYYPSIILTNGYCPETLGNKFLEVYKSIVDQRLKAKKDGDKAVADSLKIVINASFGKFGNQWSALYDPKLLLQTTITGQLCLLMLIEMFEDIGIKVISANTDGAMVVIDTPEKEDDARDVVAQWEARTKMFLEDEVYEHVYKESVNSYFAVKQDGTIKGKGTYAKPGLQKNPGGIICQTAIIEHLTNGTCFEDTINGCTDITQFIYIRTVNGGAVYNDEEVGKSVRWYHGMGKIDPITYSKNGNKVPNSQGAVLVNKLPKRLPDDIDYEFYIDKTNKMLEALGHGI